MRVPSGEKAGSQFWPVPLVGVYTALKIPVALWRAARRGETRAGLRAVVAAFRGRQIALRERRPVPLRLVPALIGGRVRRLLGWSRHELRPRATKRSEDRA